MIYIGVDPGVNTGYAVWFVDEKRLCVVKTFSAHELIVQLYSLRNADRVHIVFEDARLRKWVPVKSAKQDRARLQGAGSVKRDCQIIEDACKDWGIPYTAVAPKDNRTKLSAEQFKRLTGWAGRTNEHGRDAAMLVFGK